MARVLGVQWARATDCASRPESARLGRDRKVYHPPKDRPMSVRLAAARDRWPDPVGRLEAHLSRLPEHARMSRFLTRVCCGSAEEAFFDLRLLAASARCVQASGLRAGFRQRPIIDPETGHVVGDLRVPALELELGGLRLLLLPQVSIQVIARTPDGIRVRTLTVDFLVKAVLDGRASWLILEVDGAGHDGRGDRERSQQLGLPLLRMTTEDIESEQCLDRLAERLLQLLSAP